MLFYSILGTSQTIAMIVMGVAAVTPVSITKTIAKGNIDDINAGSGRTMAYAAKLTMPVFFFAIFPLLMIGFNSKVRKSLWKEFQDSELYEWISKLCERCLK